MKKSIILCIMLSVSLLIFAQTTGIFKDSRDGKEYYTVKIGTQTWMAENLAFKADSGCWAYKNDETNVIKYGYLYNWETAKTVCPKGWHLPSDAEWTTLTNYLGGDSIAGEKMKSKTGWLDSGNGTNASGFTALPGGIRYSSGITRVGNGGEWWSSTEYSKILVWSRLIGSYKTNVLRTYNNKLIGFSVRCIKDNSDKDNIPTIQSTTYSTNNDKNQKIFTDSRDGKVYKTITIGTKIWMAENLAFKADSGCWAYNDDETNVTKFGYLYDWETAKAVCPDGWHLPSNTEWTTLINYLGGESVAGEKMKSKTGWLYSGNGTNTSGFTALPGGDRSGDKNFINFGYAGYWWSSSESYKFQNNAWYWSIYYDNSKVDIQSSYQKTGFSVRCVKDL